MNVIWLGMALHNWRKLFCFVIHVSWRGIDLSLGIRIMNLHTKRTAKIIEGHLNWSDFDRPMMVWEVEYEDDGIIFRMNEFYEPHWDLVEED